MNKSAWFLATVVGLGMISSAFGMNPVDPCGGALKKSSRIFLEAPPPPLPTGPGSAKYRFAAAAGNYTPLSTSQILTLEMKHSVETVTGIVDMKHAKAVLDAVRSQVPAPSIAVTVWADVSHLPEETDGVVPFVEYLLSNVERIPGRAKSVTFAIPQDPPVDIYAFGRAFNANVPWELEPAVRKIRIVFDSKAPLAQMKGFVEAIFRGISQTYPSSRATVVELIAVNEENPNQVGVVERRFGKFLVED